MPRLLRLLAPLLLLAAATGCRQRPVPQPLLLADSLLVVANQPLIDSLLASYRQLPAGGGEPERMLYRLLCAGQKYKSSQPVTDMRLLDSLTRYYDRRHDHRHHAEALLFTSLTYSSVGDYSNAMNCCLKATDAATQAGDLALQAWACADEGHIYFDQTLYEQSVEPYRRYYQLARRMGNRRLQALASYRMGKVHTWLGQVDSTIYYYQQAIRLGNTLPDQARQDVVSHAQYSLADIYIQLGRYELAASLMPRDSLNASNWADWHAAQHHTDSAIAYFRQSLCDTSLYAREYIYRQLAELEAERGDPAASARYYQLVNAVQDSIKLRSQTLETLQAKARHDYRKVKAERDRADHHNRQLLALLTFLTVVVAAMVGLGRKTVRKWRARQQHSQQQLASTEHELEANTRETARLQQQLASAERELEASTRETARLRQQLADLQQRDDSEAASARQQLNVQLQQAESRREKAERQRREQLLVREREEGLIDRIRQYDKQDDLHLTNEEWLMVAAYIDHLSPDFTSRLLATANLSTEELRVCYLVRLGVKNKHVAKTLFRGPGAISMTRQRLYKKLTGKDGSARDLDSLIASF